MGTAGAAFILFILTSEVGGVIILGWEKGIIGNNETLVGCGGG